MCFVEVLLEPESSFIVEEVRPPYESDYKSNDGKSNKRVITEIVVRPVGFDPDHLILKDVVDEFFNLRKKIADGSAVVAAAALPGNGSSFLTGK